jgi:hypothetical protein
MLVCSCCQPPGVVTIFDERGIAWTFENSRMFGPLLLRADGEPRARQPGERSAFWPAWERWRDQQHAVRKGVS